MAVPVIMPRQGQSVESCIISKWYKKKGDKVAAGDLLFGYETDKASFEEEAKAEGVLLDIFFEEGDDVPVLTNVCVIGRPGESTSEYRPAAAGGAAPGDAAPGAASAAAPAAATAPGRGGREPDGSAGGLTSASAAAQPGGSVAASPRARALADRVGVDYRLAGGTGPGGRVIERDVRRLYAEGPVGTAAARSGLAEAGAAAADIRGTGMGGRVTTSDLTAWAARADAGAQTDGVPAAGAGAGPLGGAAEVPDYEEVKISNIRKVIAKSMQNSLSTMAQLTLNSSFDATEILALRKKIKEGREALGLEDITLNDMVLFAVSRVLKSHRELNAHFLDDKMLLFNKVNLGVAMDTPRGLMVPTIFNAGEKSLNEISKETKQLAALCRSGSISPDALKGGGFTVTSLGTFGIESFTPVINPPQTGILGVDTIEQKVKEVNGEYRYYPAMGLSLTFDHRALDGAPAAKFLKELKMMLESFSLLIAK